jgi:hypothetical protein
MVELLGDSIWWKDIGPRGTVLERDLGIPGVLSLHLLLSCHRWAALTLPCAPTLMFCHKPKVTGPGNHGLKHRQNKSFLFLSWLPQVLCHRSRKLTNTTSKSNIITTNFTSSLFLKICIYIYIEREREREMHRYMCIDMHRYISMCTYVYVYSLEYIFLTKLRNAFLHTHSGGLCRTLNEGGMECQVLRQKSCTSIPSASLFISLTSPM